MAGEGITIRGAEPSDAGHLVELLRVLFTLEEDFSFNEPVQRRGIELLISRQGPERQVFVAEKSGTVAGMCSIQTLISTAEGGPVGLVEDVIVSEGYRGNGIGNALMIAVGGWARKHGLKRVQLLAERGNTQALKFYRSKGWEITDLICVRKFPLF
ncbi:MAG: GNAT family N-acetyltransferase [Deltaproteobacteria bacterium]|nr:GNAT family N-acetyltransferase [Deltaproteobacteria bacterium]